ncbi:uncharacterized protein EAF01_009001 [Botrytis porri]|nr:uncharacterized protein EAF01_009796 [Botrytis porri]XP_038767651.1 uncharacterized protein EAF01_009001 [Botrytis porri]KAF7895834.1 hypothetical protein EAF01_009796 [Botrytis porri]KAF7898035.1 hypothetical protein EAF01_009001 [Botrytis porri]
MVQFGSTLLPLLMAVATVSGYSWTQCTNADRCDLASGGGSTTVGGQNNGREGQRFHYVGGYVFTYDTCSDFVYRAGDGYWYSHEKDGLFVSPTGYVRFAHDCNMMVINNKAAAVGVTYWTKSSGADCCLPDEVGHNIFRVGAYYTGRGG